MAITKEDILEAVGAMTVMELNDMVKAFEEKFGVSAASMAVAAPAAGGAAAAAEEQTDFTVTLMAAGEKKVEVIKVVRAATGLGSSAPPPAWASRKPRTSSTAPRSPSRRRSRRPTPKPSRSSSRMPVPRSKSSNCCKQRGLVAFCRQSALPFCIFCHSN